MEKINLTPEAKIFCDTLETEEDTTPAEDCFIKEMENNGYKLTVRGVDLFLDNCDLESKQNAFYRAIAIKCFYKGKLN